VPDSARCTRGLLVSVEGISGAGKTHLTRRVAATMPGGQPLILEEFSARKAGSARDDDLGRAILRGLSAASGGDVFLRGGAPRAETLLLTAIKTHDIDAVGPALADGRTVIEGRGPDSIAVYQAAILHPRSDLAAASAARQIVAFTAKWRPLPDLTILITDEPARAIARTRSRGDRYDPADQHLLHRVARLYDRLAADAGDRIRVLDRRYLDENAAVTSMRQWILSAQQSPRPCRPASWLASAGIGSSGPCATCRAPLTAQA
jgi:dTMP kinase